MPKHKAFALSKAEERRENKRELEYSNQLPIFWSRFPRLDREIVRTVWENAADADAAATMLRSMHPPAQPPARAATASSSSSPAARAEPSPAPEPSMEAALDGHEPATRGGRSAELQIESAGEWTCAVCTLINERPSSQACAACETPWPRSTSADALSSLPAAAPAPGASDGLSDSILGALPQDALLTLFSVLQIDDCLRLAATCRELRELAVMMPVRHVRLGARHAAWSDARVLGLLRHIRKLERVSVSACVVGFVSFGALCTLPCAKQLVSLSLSSPLLIDTSLEGWAVSLPNLEELRLAGCDLASACAPHLCAFSRLSTLDLSANRKLETRTVAALMLGCRSLKALDVSHLSRLGRAVCSAPLAPQLRELSCKGLALEAATLSSWTRLHTLSMQESALVQLAISLPALRTLSAAGSKSLQRLELVGCASLRSLTLASCASLAELLAEPRGSVPCAQQLEELNLAMCRKLDARTLAALLAPCAHTLARANLNGLTRVREEPLWLGSAAEFRGRMGAQLQFVDLRGSCPPAMPTDEALFDRRAEPHRTRRLPCE
jgi:hypothetical protein